jgi:hypothetical protein
MLPLSRNRTYADDTIMYPSDLNDIQDWIIETWARQHGEKEISWGLGAAYDTTDWSPSALFGIPAWLSSVSGSDIHFAGPLEVGMRVKSVRVWLMPPSAGGNMDVNVFLNNGSLGSASSSGTAVQAVVVDFADFTYAIGDVFKVEVQSPATTNDRYVTYVGVVVDRDPTP